MKAWPKRGRVGLLRAGLAWRPGMGGGKRRRKGRVESLIYSATMSVRSSHVRARAGGLGAAQGSRQGEAIVGRVGPERSSGVAGGHELRH